MAPKKSTSKLQYWSAQIAKWRDSGQPATQFCRRRRIHIASFYNWRKRLVQAEKSAPVEKPTFIPVTVAPSPVMAVETDVEIAIEGGRTVHLKGHLSPAHLAEITQALVSTC